jgi:hypothetical protein
MALVPPGTLAHSTAPFADAARTLGGDWAAYAVALGAAISCFGGVNGWILIVGQLPKAIADDGLFPGVFGKVSARGTPAHGMVIAAVLTTTLIAMNYSQRLVDLFTFIILLATLATLVPYVFCSLAGFVLGRRDPRMRMSAGMSVVAGLAFAYALWAIGGAGRTWCTGASCCCSRGCRCMWRSGDRRELGRETGDQGDDVGHGTVVLNRDTLGTRAAEARQKPGRSCCSSTRGTPFAPGPRMPSGKPLHFTAEPDVARAIDEYERFVAMLRASGAEIAFLDEADGTSLDSIYVRDASIVTTAARSCAGWASGSGRGNRPRRRRRSARWACRSSAPSSRPARSRAGTSRGSTRGRSPSGGATAPTTRGSRSCGLLGDAVDELLVVPLPHWRGPGDVFHLMSIVSPVDRDLAVVYSPLMPVPFREALLERGSRSSRCPTRSSIRWAATCWQLRRAGA